VSTPDREAKLLQRAAEARILEKRAERWARRYHGLLKEDDLLGLGGIELTLAVRAYKDELGSFEDFCARRVDWAMLDGIRIEAREKRIDRAAQRAAADLLALYRADPKAAPREWLTTLAQAVAAATFAAMTEEAQRGGEGDMIARQEYATALRIMRALLEGLPRPQRKLFVLVYQEGKTLVQAQEVLGVHQNTVERWHAKVLEAIRAQLEKAGITHSPGRGGAPRVAVLARLRVDADEEEPQR
jgi:RNA polymerase sigma factor (sigma-70 family)